MQNFKNEIISSSLVKVRESFLQKIPCQYTKSLSIIRCKITTRIFFIVLKYGLAGISHRHLIHTYVARF